MPVIIGPNYFQLTVEWDAPVWASGSGASVFGFFVDDGPATSDNAADALAALMDNLMAWTTDTVTCTGARWASETLGGALITNQTGSLTSEVPAPHSTMLFRKVTQFRGPRGRGRTYWPMMVAENEVTEGGIVNGTRLATINNALESVVDDWATAGLVQVVLQGSGGESTPYDPAPPVTAFFCDAKVATQRRRLRK